ncbi:BamA/TamA family outer membrane protein [bacterium]|nr:BamA/TamA family outer membrane protein [bacterium]
MTRKRYSLFFVVLTLLAAASTESPAQKPETAPGTVFPFTARTAGAPLDSVAVTGVDSLATSIQAGLAGEILSRAGEPPNEGLIDHDTKAAETFLRERGWWNAQVTAFVDSAAGKPCILTFSIEPGKLVKFGLISAEPKENDIGVADIPIPEIPGQSFTKDMLESVINDIMSRFAENGYPGAEVTPVLSAHGDTVDITLKYKPGGRAHIDSVAVRGLSRTKDFVVLRELSSIRGMPAGKDAVNEARAIVRQLDFLGLSQEPYLDYAPDGTCMLVLDLEEKGLGSFDGVIGYQPSDSGESGELIGTVDIDIVNMFGTGRSSRIRWEKLGKQTEDLELVYREPRIISLPFGVSGHFLQEERGRIGYTLTRFDAKINRRYRRLTVETGYRYEKASADSLTSSHANGIEAGITWTEIDDSDNPRSGIRYGGTWSALSKAYRFGSKDRARIDHTAVDLDHYIPTLQRQTVALLIRYRRVQGDKENLDPADRYWLGGASTIRGYRERLFPAVEALWGSAEYRFLTGGTSRFFLFVDSGYLIDYVRTADRSFRKKTLTRTGYGFGLRLSTRAGTLGFDYGLGQGDSPGQGKLHVRLSAEF